MEEEEEGRRVGGSVIEPSEFGKGLVICLVKFAEHFYNDMAHNLGHIEMYLGMNQSDRELMLSANPPDRLNYGKDVRDFLRYWVEKTDSIFKGDLVRSLSHDIELWASGASDHLYDIEVPKRADWNLIGKKVEELRKLGLSMGHGFINNNPNWTMKDVQQLRNLTREISLMIDKKLGLKPEIGKW